MKLGDIYEIDVFKRMIKTGAAEADVSWRLIPSISQALKTLDPRLPIKQQICGLLNLSQNNPYDTTRL